MPKATLKFQSNVICGSLGNIDLEQNFHMISIEIGILTMQRKTVKKRKTVQGKIVRRKSKIVWAPCTKR